MEISPLFDLKKVLFLPCLHSTLGWEVVIGYIHLVVALNVPIVGSRLFSPISTSLSALKKWFFGRVFSYLSFLEFVPRIAPLQIELAS